MKIMKRTTAWLMTILLIMSVLPSSLMLTAFASQFVDFPTGWSAEAVQAAVDNGLLEGKGNGKLEPQAKLTRAEAAAVINRAFGSTVKADISSFTDVSTSDWYYDDFAKAVNMKTFVGDGETHLNPNNNITREELFTVFARALVLSDYDTEVLNKFSDVSSISDYAMPYLAALVKNEYVNGNADGTLNPKGLITREEFAQMMHNTFKTYISTSGTVTSVDGQDSVMIRVPNVTLKDVTIEKDLVLGDGVGAGDVTLKNVTIKGRLLCRGGEGYVDLVDTTVGDKVVVYDVNGTVNFHNYETEEPFKDHVQHTPATFLQKKPIGGGGGGSSSSKYRYYDIEVYFQNDSDLPTAEPTYGSRNTSYDLSVKAEKNETVTLTWKDIDELYKNVGTGWETVIKVRYELDTTNSKLTGENDGDLVLKVYLKKKVFSVTAPNGTTYKYFYEDLMSSNDALSQYIDDYEKEQEAKGYNVTWTDADGNPIEDTHKISKDIALVAVLTPIPYNIEYYSDGVKLDLEPNTYNVETETFDLPVPTKEGYFFAGWHEKEDLSDDRIKQLVKGTIGNKKFYAAWSYDALAFEASVSGNTVTVDVTLTNIPADIDDIASIDIEYGYDAEKLDYVGTESKIGDVFAASAGEIAWLGNAALTALPADKVLFTITFTRKASAYGVAEFEFVSSEICDTNMDISSAYAEIDDSVDFGDAPGPDVKDAILKFDASLNGNVVTVKAVLNKIPDDIKDLASIDINYTFDNTKLAYKDTVSAIGDVLIASANNIAWNGATVLTEIPADGVLFTITFDVISGATGTTTIAFGDVELMDSEYNISTAYKKVNGEVEFIADPAVLSFDATLNGDIVTVKAVLNKIPDDIKDLASIDINYTFDNTKLAYKDTVSAIGDVLIASANNIAWNGATVLTEIPADGVLFTITFDVISGATGMTAIAFGDVELMDSEYNISTAYTTANDEVELIADSAVLRFNASLDGNVVTVKAVLDKIPDDIKDLASIDIDYTFDDTMLSYKDTVSAIGDVLIASANNIAWNGATVLTEIPADGVLFTITFDVISGATGTTAIAFGDVELMDSEYNISANYTKVDGIVTFDDASFYTVKIYKGVEKDSNLKDTIENVVSGTYLTEDEVYAKLGKPELYQKTGYTDSDGKAHNIVPTLMYNNNGVWEEFDIAKTPVTKDLALCLLSKTLSVTITSDRTIKGYNIPEIPLEIPYDSESAVGESVLDAMTISQSIFTNILNSLKEDKNVDLYAKLVEKLAAKGLTDANGNIIAKDIKLKMSDFLSAEEIEGKIDEYISENLEDDNFIASILENDAIVNSLLDNDDIKIGFMKNIELREKLLSDEEFIKDMANDPEIVDAIIKSDSFKTSFIENDATIQYILSDEEIKDYILNHETFRKILIDECVKFVINVYFEETVESPELVAYIDEELNKPEFIASIEEKADELKELFETELKALIKDADGNVEAQIFAEIRDKTSGLRNKIIDTLLTDGTIKESIKSAIKGDDTFKADIKTTAKDVVKTNPDFQEAVKNWVMNNVKSNEFGLQDKLIEYVMASDVKYDLMVENGVDSGVIDSYKDGSIDPDLKQDIDDEIAQNFRNNSSEIVYDYFDEIYTASYDNMYEDFFDELYEDDAVFGYAYDAFAATRSNFEKAFDEYIGDGTVDNTNIENAYNTFVNNETAFHEFYVDYVGDTNRFNELFESYYSTHVHDVAKSAYKNEALKGTVMKYVHDHTEVLAVEYANSTLETNHPNLVDTINKLMEDDMPLALREAYATNSELKLWIDSLIEAHADELIEKYINNGLKPEEKKLVDDAIADYADEIAESYIDGSIDTYTKNFVDTAVRAYVDSIIDDFVNNVNRDDVREFILDYAQDAVNAYKQTDVYKDLIAGFKNGDEYIVVNAENLLLVRGIATAVDSYTYEQIKNEFIDAKFHKVLDLIGDDVISEYVEEATTGFVTGLNEVCDKVDADVENGITDSSYNYPAALNADINVVAEIVYPVYNKVMNKVKAKLNSEPAIRYEQNTYLKKLVNTNLLDEMFFDKATDADGKIVYSIKRDIEGMYDVAVEMTVLAHDALIWYNKLDDSEVDAMTSGAAAILAGYANKLNGIVMNYIENDELPGGLTLDEILSFNGNIEEYYNKYEDKIEKALEKYEQYMDRDYEVIFDKLATGSIVANGEAFKLTDIVIENKVFDIDDLFDAMFSGKNFADNDKVQRVVNKLKSAQYTPTADNSIYYIDAYKATLNNREISGVSTGNTTVDIQRYLQ